MPLSNKVKINKKTGINLLVWVGIAALGVFIYYPLRTAGFLLFDDDWSIYSNPYVTSLNILNCFRYIYYFDYVPISTFYFSLVNWIFGMDPFFYHLLNVLFHFINSWLSYLLGRRVFRFSQTVAVTFAILFLIHPMHVESVAWATEAKDILSVFFLLSSWLAFQRFKENKHKGILAYFASTVLFFLSLGSKTITITFPVLLLIHSLMEGGYRGVKKNAIQLIPFFGLSLAFGLLRIYAVTGKMALMGSDVGPLSILGNTLIKIVFYFSRSIFPHHLAGFYEGGVFKLLWYEYLIVTAFVAVLAALYKLSDSLNEKRFVVFFPVFTLIALFPTLKIIPWSVNFVVADRYIYFPSIGLFALFALLVGKLLSMEKFKLIVTVYLILLTAHLTLMARERVIVWHNDFNLWADVLKKYPDTQKGLHNLSVQYLRMREFKKALELQERLLELNPNNIMNRINMISPQAAEGDIDAAIEQVEKLEKEVHMDFTLAQTLSILYYHHQKPKKAAEKIMIALHFDPTHSKLHRLLSSVNQELKDEKIYRYQKKLIEHYNLSIPPDPPQPLSE